MEMVAGVLLVGLVRLVRPIDPDFLHERRRVRGTVVSLLTLGSTNRLVDSSSVQGGHGTLGGTGIIVLHKAIVVTLGLN